MVHIYLIYLYVCIFETANTINAIAEVTLLLVVTVAEFIFLIPFVVIIAM